MPALRLESTQMVVGSSHAALETFEVGPDFRAHLRLRTLSARVLDYPTLQAYVFCLRRLE